jgi:16S rRNA (adenine1518-N6/adenine1519-N6)-dimethyltransferase
VERVIEAGFARAVFLVQKEVALRLAARYGTRDYGYLSAVTQLAAEVEFLFEVKPGAFAPPPKVDSAVVRLVPRGTPVPAPLRRFLSTCFHLKRKNLRNNLHALFPAIDTQPEARLRAEQLSPAELAALHLRLIE